MAKENHKRESAQNKKDAGKSTKKISGSALSKSSEPKDGTKETIRHNDTK